MIGVSKHRAWLMLTLLAALPSCGGSSSHPRAAASGNVTLDGAPLATGAIRFVPVEDTPGQITSVQVVDGLFEVSAEHGPTVGTHRIEIESTDTGGLAMDDEDAMDRLRSEGTKRVQVVKVPPRYNKSSDLRETVVKDGPNEFSFELSTRRKRR